MTNFYQVTFQNCRCCGPEYKLYIDMKEHSEDGVVSWPNFGELVRILYPVLSSDKNPVRFVPDNLPEVEKSILEELVVAHNFKLK